MSKLLRPFTVHIYKSQGRRYSQRIPEFAKDIFKLSRGNYNYVKDEHLKHFEKILGANRVITNQDDVEKYNQDWFLQLRGCSKVVLKPKTTKEVSEILSFCNKNKLAVCPHGGNTSVSGGATPIFDEIVISTELMNEIISLDENAGVVVSQAGCILENLDNFVAAKGLIIPLDIGAKGSCQIGGNISTNAGGLRVLRYGNLHGNVLGIEVVKADGEVLDCLTSLKKDNTGYHLKNIFIGSEGTLGFVTKVAIQCPARPKYKNLAFLGLQNFEKVLKSFRLLKQKLGEILSAVEIMDTPTMDFIQKVNGQNSPIGDYPFYLLIETSGSNEQHDGEKLNNFLQESLDKGLVLNGTVVSEPAKVQELWSIRENIANGFKCIAPNLMIFDISVDLENYYRLVDDVSEYAKEFSERVFGFGHLGDGNLHLQIQLKDGSIDENKKNINAFISDRVIHYKGSISSEHGVGITKVQYMNKIKSKNELNIMRDLKMLFDPNGILNPYKTLP